MMHFSGRSRFVLHEATLLDLRKKVRISAGVEIFQKIAVDANRLTPILVLGRAR